VAPSGDPSLEAGGGWARAALGALTGREARKGAVALADQAVASGINFLAGVAVGRTCSKEEFGLYALGFTVVVFLLNLQNTLVTLPYTINYPDLPGEGKTGYTSSSLLHHLAFSALCSAALFPAGWALAASGGPDGLARVLQALAIGIPFLLLREYSRQINFAWLRVRSALAVDLATAAIYLGGLFYLGSRQELSAARTFLLSGAACLLAAVGWLLRTRREFSFGSARPVPDFLRNWKLSRWPLAALFANLASMQLYPWFLAGFHGTEVTGVFSACMGTILLVNPFVIGMGNYLGPRIVHAHALEGAKRPAMS
jgi:O-antigen/teichoic acid export membrane protein